jgi:branched-chain amino acid transport system ATP-binding protein
MLEVQGLAARYGAIDALRGVSLTAAVGRTTAVIGANGAGKTTLVRAIVGLTKPYAGTVRFDGQDLGPRSVTERVRLGLTLVPEGRGLIGNLTVEENLLLGGYCRRGSLSSEMATAFEIFPRLERLRKRRARLLSGGELQMLAIGRAIVAKPKLMILDEPSMGLAPIAVDGVIEALKVLKSEGGTLLLVEQNAAMAFELADLVYVLEVGENAVSGTPDRLLDDPNMRRAYFGIA